MKTKLFIKNKLTILLNEDYITKDGKLDELLQKDINEILKGYLEAAIWTEEERLNDDIKNIYNYDDDDDDDDQIEKLVKSNNKKPLSSFTSDDLDIDSKIDAYNDIKKFIINAGDDAIKEAITNNGLFQLEKVLKT